MAFAIDVRIKIKEEEKAELIKEIAPLERAFISLVLLKKSSLLYLSYHL